MVRMGSRSDRVEGVLLGMAVGDALGAPYEFEPPRAAALEVAMVGGGAWEPGEWTDDTAVAIAIAEVAATGADLRDESAQDVIAARWLEWAAGAKDVGIQTRSVLHGASRRGISAASARAEAVAVHRQTGRSAGNGSLMRTAPVALAYLDDEDGLVAAARAISELTHFDPEAGDACVLWSTAIAHAVRTGELDIRVGLGHLDVDRRRMWSQRLDVAESACPADFPRNGWVVEALQAAWCAIATTEIPADDPAAGSFRADHLRDALDAAVRGGYDTDTVAAIAGGLLGAAHGASAVPLQWRALLHGWPDLRAHDLVGLAAAIERRGKRDRFDFGYPGIPATTVARHPQDANVLLGGISALRRPPEGIDAVVSLCRVAHDDMRRDVPHVEVRLIDRAEADDNPHLDRVLLDAVRTVEEFRAQGRTVLVHCVQALSRTPTIAALYGARRTRISIDDALDEVLAVLPDADPNPAFRAALQRLHPTNLTRTEGRSDEEFPAHR